MGVGLVIHVFSKHWLGKSMISWNLFCPFSHCVCVSCSYCNVSVRLIIARLCESKKVVWSF